MREGETEQNDGNGIYEMKNGHDNEKTVDKGLRVTVNIGKSLIGGKRKTEIVDGWKRNHETWQHIFTVKKVTYFPVPSRGVTNQ